MRKTAWVLGLLAALHLHAASPELVFDISNGGEVRSSEPSRFFSNGRVAWFFANDGSGAELWTTDGTEHGTRMVADLTPGPQPDYLYADGGAFTASGDLVWFWYPDPFDRDDLALWRTDGTRDGTFAVARGLGSDALHLAPLGARGIVAHSSERFLSSDGTVEGTRDMKEDARPEFLVSFRGHVYYTQNRDLWRTDGTEAGTVLIGSFNNSGFGEVRDVVAGIDGIYVVGDNVGGSDNCYIWKYDGSRLLHQAVLIRDEMPRLVATSRGVYAVMDVDDAVTEIWRLSGQIARTTVVQGDTESYTFLQSAGDYFYFETGDPDQLWRSDGTAGDTRVFKGVDLFTSRLFPTRSRVFSLSDSGVQVSDGTTATKISPHAARGYDAPAAAVGNLVVMAIEDETHGIELWVSDGTAQGTRLLKNIRADRSSDGLYLRRFGDGLLFSAVSESEGREPWISDGTLFGTRLLADIIRGATSGEPRVITPLANGRALFIAGARLYGTDGNRTEMLRQAFVDVDETAFAGQLPVIGGRAWIVYDGNQGDELWASDGTPGGTLKLVEFPYTDRDFPPVAANGVLFFVARDALWRTDGTVQGTFAVASRPEQMHAVGSRLFFLSWTTAHGRELWVTDGTLGGTHIVKDIRRGEEGAFPYDYPYDDNRLVMQTAGDLLFFAADDGVHGLEPWRSDGTEAGTFLLGDLAPGEASSMLPMFDREVAAFADGSLFFGADDGVHGYELWRSDLQQTTELLRDISVGRGSSSPMHLRAIGDLVYFSADDGRHGRELWWATPAGAGLAADVNPGPDSSLPREMTELNGSVYFFAATETTGDELWRVGPPKATRRRSAR
jgi:ELWxxDGT repeat protein